MPGGKEEMVRRLLSILKIFKSRCVVFFHFYNFYHDGRSILSLVLSSFIRVLFLTISVL
jgi:hypothetical protein